MTAGFGVTLFAAVLAHQLAISQPNGYVSVISSHRKFLSDNRGCYKYNLSLFPVSA